MPELLVILTWVGLGLIAGLTAKFLMPGHIGGGYIQTTILGILGSFLGGFIADKTGLATLTPGVFSAKNLIFAVIGALIILMIFRLTFGRR